MNGKEIPAVVVGAGLNGLGVVRSLKAAGVSAWILDANAKQVGMYTHAARPAEIGCMEGVGLVNALLSFSDRLTPEQRPILILTQEESVKAISEHRDVLRTRFRFSLPEQRVLQSLMHKEKFHRIAEQHMQAVPRLIHIRTIEDGLELKRLRFPIVLKPGERNAAYSSQFKKAYRLETPEEAEELVHRVLAVMPDIVAQEWIEGTDADIYFCLQYVATDGAVASSFTGRKIRSWPPRVGGTASCVAAPEASSTLSAMTTRFFSALGVQGFAAMEYKRDARSGQFLMVEPTVGRTDYQAEVATLNGSNLPFAAYCSLLGLPTTIRRTRQRLVVWRDRDADTQSAALQGQHPNEGIPLTAIVQDALWRWSDPVPFVTATAQRFLRAGKGRLSRIRGYARWLESK